MPLLDQHGNPIRINPNQPFNIPPQGLPGLHRPDQRDPRGPFPTADAALAATARPTTDNFQNFMASVGYGTNNLNSGSTYGFNPITRERTLLEWMYRSSWICGVCIDAVADDMVKMGVDWTGSVDSQVGEEMAKAFRDLGLWQQLNGLIKWGRMYGGAVAVIEIAGQDPTTPLRLETVGKGTYRGLTVMDRWMVEPSMHDLVTEQESATDKGLPRYYRVTADAPAFPRQTVHYTRTFRYEGFDLPYWQRLAENLWGLSIFERFYDRLIAFDSGTQGIAQLIYKAYLRWIKIKDLRLMISTGGENMRRVLNQIDMMRFFQTNEGISLLDGDDEFGTTTYSFDGLRDVLLGMGEQLSGALQIPLVRLFGQSPAGLNSTGESDLRMYYDGVHQAQELRLRRPLEVVSMVIARSEGIALPTDFSFAFQPLWQLQPTEKAQLTQTVTQTVIAAYESGLVSRKRALEELRQSSQQTGIWATLTEEEIEEAEFDMPPGPGPMPYAQQPTAPGGPSAAQQTGPTPPPATQGGEPGTRGSEMQIGKSAPLGTRAA